MWDSQDLYNPQQRILALKRELALLPDADYVASVQAKDLADVVAAALGADYTVFGDLSALPHLTTEGSLGTVEDRESAVAVADDAAIYLVDIFESTIFHDH